ncbi:LysR family transcriptional regulator [Paludibacterium yongneupense]|uniref:LysR family transcriptional regulator n=1 Tax=Paludibacterium yongneupense TaxID=400061 RepID=UPI0003F731EF|nr:LysR family transcriptional regulator [Paludibacterium yongneupense]
MKPGRMPRSQAEHWRVLQVVVESGGYAQAAAALHRSQSAVSYALARLQQQLGVELLEADGRRMRLTAAGETLLREAVPLVDGLARLDERAVALQQGWEAEVRLAVDTAFPTAPLLRALHRFAGQCVNTRLQLHEVVLSGADQALYGGQVDLAVGARVPPGFLGDALIDVEFVAVAAPDHPLHQLGRTLVADDLVEHTQAVVRDSGTQDPRDAGWLGAKQRWTVSRVQTSIAMVASGLAFAWLPRHLIAEELAGGRLLELPLGQGRSRAACIFLTLADPGGAGPATRALAALLQEEAKIWTLDGNLPR